MSDLEDETDLCPKCHKKVYFNERAPPFLTFQYHKKCFKCTKCNNRLYAAQFQDHEAKPYCDTCYYKYFATNRLSYRYSDEGPKTEIDRSDPLLNYKNGKGRLSVEKMLKDKGFDQLLNNNNNNKLNKNKKLYGYMMGQNVTLLLEGRLKFIHSQIRKRLVKMIQFQLNSFQNKLIERIDYILEEEIINLNKNNKNKLNHLNNLNIKKQQQIMEKNISDVLQSININDINDAKQEEQKIIEQNGYESDLDTNELLLRLSQPLNNK